ncbi:hypothetical protein RCS94_06440 [Orbaceae bacterium ac157xtp]
MAKHITAASVIMTLVADELYPTGRVIEGFAEDNLRSLEDLTLNESIMGVDGKLSHGYVEHPVVLTVSLMPDQDGYAVFENIAQAQKTLRAPIILSMTIVDVGLNRKYTLTHGALNNWKPMPDATRLLQATDAVMTFERCTWEEYGA